MVTGCWGCCCMTGIPGVGIVVGANAGGGGGGGGAAVVTVEVVEAAGREEEVEGVVAE